MSEQIWWYATRAAGLMTWTTATASVVLGLLLSTRAVRHRTGPWFLDLHRFLGGISVVFLLAHLGTLWADSYVDFGPREILIPGASEWKPEAIAWGIVAAYLLIAIEVSSLLRKRIGSKLWRVIHFSSFAAMIGGSYHAYLAGSDVENPITWAIAGIGSLLVMGLVSMRLQRQDPDEPGAHSFSDNRAILEEMRLRLEELPIPESTPQPQISLTPNPSLPRRAPVGESFPGIDTRPDTTADHSVGFSDDPFDALPTPDKEPALGDWADRSSADPFDAPTDPFRIEPQATELPTRTPPAPEPEPTPTLDRPPWATEGSDLFDEGATDPFAALGISPPESTEGFPELPTYEEAVANDPKMDLFAAALPGESDVEFLDDPFSIPVPTTDTFAEPAPEPAPLPTRTPRAVDGPPPLPDAVDPATGEPDQAAYTEWLKDWLVFAEKYGDEAPDDPNRII